MQVEPLRSITFFTGIRVNLPIYHCKLHYKAMDEIEVNGDERKAGF